MMAAQTAARPLFHLADLADDPFYLPPAPTLPRVAPEFALPGLDEFAPGTDRLLSAKAAPRPDTQLASPVAAFLAPVRPELVLEDEAQRDDDDIWGRAADAVAGPSRPRAFEPIRTWDREPHVDPYVTEQPMAFEALLVSTPLPIPRLKSSHRTMPRSSRELLLGLLRATTGVASSDVLWHPKEARFIVAEGARCEGVDGGTAASWVWPWHGEGPADDRAMQLFLSLGTAVRRLEMIVDGLGSCPITPTHHALLHAVSTYLSFTKQRLDAAIEESAADTATAGAWNRWSLALKDTHDLSAKLCEVVCWPLSSSKSRSMPSRASSLLTHLHAHLLAYIATCSPAQQRGSIALALAFVLRQSSGPFLERLHQWVGLADATALDTDPDADVEPWADIGVSRAKKADGKWEYSFSSRGMPGFIDRDVRKALFEAGKSLRALRDASDGQHPLCEHDWGIKAAWGWGGERIMEIDVWKGATLGSAYSRPRLSGSMSKGLRRFPQRKSRKSLPAEFVLPLPSPTKPPRSSSTQDLFDLFDLAPGAHLAVVDPSPLWAPTPLDDLEAFLAHHADPARPLLTDDAPTLPQHVAAHVLAPLVAHADVLARARVAYSLVDLRLLAHLDVLRAFWLAGDAGFAERVANALFGADGAGAGEALGLGRRARTRARMGLGGGDAAAVDLDAEWGIGLGLGLSERQRWPPGGAELAYALRTTLLDDDGHARGDGVWDGIEDRVSFAVRALPEDDSDGRRARWLDPQAIEALDFLYLAYSPPPAVAPLLPASIMARYQAIHNLLLRISRAEAVVRSMYFDVLHLSEPSTKTGVDAARRPARFASHAKDSLFPVRSAAEQTAYVLRLRMAHFVAALHAYVVDTAIGANWTVMRRRLERLRDKSAAPDRGSRPGTPVDDDFFDTVSLDEPVEGDAVDGPDDGGEYGDDDDGDAAAGQAQQLRSVDSIVLYHAVVLERVARACLLSTLPGHAATSRLLMSLLGLVLDAGKALKETARGLRGWEDAAERLAAYAREWDDKERVFLHALERLAARAHSKDQAAPVEPGAEDADGAAGRDLRVLLDDEGQRRGAEELGELLLRLRLGGGGDKGTRRRQADM